MPFKDHNVANAYWKAYRESHKTVIAERQRAYYATHGEEIKKRRQQYFKDYYESHKIERCIKKKAYREAHKAEESARGKAYRSEHKEEILIKDRVRHANYKIQAICPQCQKPSLVYSKFCSRQCAQKWNAGEHHPFWKGGISYEPYCPKFNDEFKQRARAFFDDMCILCGKSKIENGKNLHVHHVEYNKTACCDGKPVHFAALCSSCHTKTNHGNRQNWEDMLHRIIDEIYGGRSYFTKDEWGTSNE